MYHPPKKKFNGLLPGDGMSLGNSTIEDRAIVLDKIMDSELNPSECIKFGFFIGEHYPGPIPDYNKNQVKREINLTHLKNEKT